MKFTAENLQRAFPLLASKHPSMIELILFNFADNFAKSINGQWSMEKVSNNLFVLPPKGNYKVSVNGNGYNGVMDEYSLGVALTIALNSHLAWDGYNKTGVFDEHTEKLYTQLLNDVNSDKRFDSKSINGFLD